MSALRRLAMLSGAAAAMGSGGASKERQEALERLSEHYRPKAELTFVGIDEVTMEAMPNKYQPDAATLAAQAERVAHAVKVGKATRHLYSWAAYLPRDADAPYTARSWPEDAPQENGNYENTCVWCELLFTGNKHRRCCKVCARV